ncbi:LAXTG-anchored chaplin ChpB [Streptomyces coacervatus]|uniref:LAXTG-anchored chaplin ChpB n=1 Tax=Streptomyces coacervatus TaxID=647381 RepID=A0ABP7GMI8_9ACTN
MIAVAAASGAMALTVPAYAAAAAQGAGADSPGVLSGNTVQLPVHVPVNVCGNTVNVVGLLNPAVGNSCSNKSAGGGHTAGGGSAAHGSGKDSPGVISGNTVQLPVHAPVNVSGNTANVIGAGNAAVGNESTNHSGGHARHCGKPAPKPSAPARAHPQPAAAQYAAPRQAAASLAHTGTDQTLPAALASAALVLGGAAVHRRFRPRPMR